MSTHSPLVIGRYALHDEIARGGMATVHLGRLVGVAGFSRTVAIKRLHHQYAKDPEFVAMFIDEARLAGRIHHPHVASVIDVVALEGELLLVMDFVRGISLSKLLSASRLQKATVSPGIAARIACDTLRGLHAAHEAKSERGEPLGIVHRDVSPQNILVDDDGSSRVIDFGIAKAASRIQDTKEGQIKGKIWYMAPEQVRAGKVDRRADVYALAVVLWEMLAGRRMYVAEEDVAIVYKIVEGRRESLRSIVDDIPAELEAVLERALALKPEKRFSTALEMVEALENAVPLASDRDVARWVAATAPAQLDRQAKLLSDVESNTDAVFASLGGPAEVTAPSSVSRESLSSEGPCPAETATDTTSSIPGPRPGGKRLGAGAIAVGALVVALAAALVLRGMLTSSHVETRPAAASASAESTANPAQPSPIPSASGIERHEDAPTSAPSSSSAGKHAVPGPTRPPISPTKKKKDYGF